MCTVVTRGLGLRLFFMAVHVNFEEVSSLLEKDIITCNIEEEIFKQLEENYEPQENFKKLTKPNKPIVHKALISLDEIYGATLANALSLVETNSVRFYHTKKSKELGVYQVIGKTDFSYTIFPFINYCYCPAYKHQVITGTLLSCKHVLAAKLAKIFKKVIYIEITPYKLHELQLATAGVNERSGSFQEEMNKREEVANQNQLMEPCIYPQQEIPGGFPQPNNWVHVLPHSGTPRLTSNMHPPVVRFTAGDISPGDFIVPHHPVKRKLNVTFDLSPPKQLVTDERMAAHMSNLHISDVKSQCLNPDDEPMDTDRLPRLVLSDDVKNLKTEPIIPDSLLQEIERPKMAVVLWQPPGNDIVSKLTELKKEKEKTEKEESSMIIENNNVDNIFRPIDPVPMRPALEDHFVQPTPQLHPYFPLYN